jgi:hypothetical protein
MNLQQAGYTQALVDLGFHKEAGILDSVTRAAKTLFARKTPTTAIQNTGLNPLARTIIKPSGVPTPAPTPTPTQLQFMEGLKSRSVAPQAPFKTMAEQAPAAAVAPAARAKNLPGYDPAAARLQAAPKTPVNIAQQNQFAGNFPERARQLRQSDQMLQAQQQTPILNSLFQNRGAQPQLQEALSLFG